MQSDMISWPRADMIAVDDAPMLMPIGLCKRVSKQETGEEADLLLG